MLLSDQYHALDTVEQSLLSKHIFDFTFRILSQEKFDMDGWSIAGQQVAVATYIYIHLLIPITRVGYLMMDQTNQYDWTVKGSDVNNDIE